MKIRYIVLALFWFGISGWVSTGFGWAVDTNGKPASASDPLANMNKLPPAQEQMVATLRTDLQAKGFAVARGYWTLWGVDDCKYPMQTVGYMDGYVNVV